MKRSPHRHTRRLPTPIATVRRSATTLLLAGALAVLLAACGRSRSTVVGQAIGFQGRVQIVERYARCMRTHGIQRFPDPIVANTGGSHSIQLHPPAGIDPSSPAFKSASKGCNGMIAPIISQSTPQTSSPTRRSGLLAFAQCMRAHGFTRFPDPGADGQLEVAAVQAAGIDVTAPAVDHVAYACAPASHGALTRRDITESIARARAGTHG